MQKSIRMNEAHLLVLAARARFENSLQGHLYKKSADTGRWRQRWFVLYKNLLFYYESDVNPKLSGVALLEGCHCEKVVSGSTAKGKESERQYCFALSYQKDGPCLFELRADSESERGVWILAITEASFSKLLEQREQLQQKHDHLLQILDSERKAKWHYVQQTEELTAEVKNLKTEIQEYRRDKRSSNHLISDQENEEIRKIKKVQSFFRGWMCRRRWKQIVELYIRSDHAESMRKRNSIVFGMVEQEEEYVKHLSALVTLFLRPFRMAASSKKPPITHEDVNSIFLNSETLLFLHQIFLKGLVARMESWPTLVLGDLFDMLLPMLGIYQEYVRNHHYSLQVLAEYKQKPDFNHLLRRNEEKQLCDGRTLETFLTYPMCQVPRYIITIHSILAHTAHDHVERRSLEFAMSKLEELSQVMQDEVSETENIRKNLAIERMIVQGCDILLDVEQTFIRQGSLIQVTIDKSKLVRLGSFTSPFKDSRKQTYYGKISLSECTLVEDVESLIYTEEDTMSCASSTSLTALNMISLSLLPSLDRGSRSSERESRAEWSQLEFRIIIDTKSGPPETIILMASSLQEKSAWCSDISQCIENLHYSDILNSSVSDTSSVTMPQSIRSDPRLYRDNNDIKFSRTLNSCKVPQIRHASLEKLLDRLTDLRFLSIDFLNTFLLTYRVFTTGHAVLEALKRVYRNPEYGNIDSQHRPSMAVDEMSSSLPSSLRSSLDYSCQISTNSKNLGKPEVEVIQHQEQQKQQLRNSGAGAVMIEILDNEVTDEQLPRMHRESVSSDHHDNQNFGAPGNQICNYFDSVREGMMGRQSSRDSNLELPKARLAPVASFDTFSESFDLNLDADEIFHDTLWFDSREKESCSSRMESGSDPLDSGATDSPFSFEYQPLGECRDGDVAQLLDLDASSCETVDNPLLHPELLSHLKTDPSVETLTCALSDSHESNSAASLDTPISDSAQPVSGQVDDHASCDVWKKAEEDAENQLDAAAVSQGSGDAEHHQPLSSLVPSGQQASSAAVLKRCSVITMKEGHDIFSALRAKSGGKRFSTESEISFRTSSYTPRSSCATSTESPLPSAKAGAVVTSSRASKRRSSSAAASAAFAAATAASSNPKDIYMIANGTRFQTTSGSSEIKAAELSRKRESAISSAATMRVLNILRHWLSKHSQDFERNAQLQSEVEEFLAEIASYCLTSAELKALTSVHQVLTRDEDCLSPKIDLNELLAVPEVQSQDNFDTLSALDIAEEMTYLDHQIFVAIRSEELLNQAWMKSDKATRAPHVLFVTNRFNQASRLVVSEIINRQNLSDRVACIEKWAAIADICRCLHNYNGVLQICAAFVNSSVFRLKKTWEKISKQAKQMIDRLQTLISSDGRFKNMRDALHRCDPPCIPYLGMYLTDLSFIDEGTPNVTEERLINFSKMRMISHVVREIQHFQQTSYRIEHRPKVAAYLLDNTRLLEEDVTYRWSLQMEPRTARLSLAGQNNV